MRNYFFFILILCFSCNQRSNQSVQNQTYTDTVEKIPQYTVLKAEANLEVTQAEANTEVLVEHFVDSVKVGQKKLNKIELIHSKMGDSNYVKIKFWAKQQGKWLLKNKFEFPKDDILPCDVNMSDFNHDGFLDITYVSDRAARMANGVRNLFIYDKRKDELTYIVNSEEYPNMLYNKELNCIDAFLVYGRCSTVFLRIKGNKLKPFASVELFHGLRVVEYDNNENEHILQEDSTSELMLTRFKNYKPLKEYEDSESDN